MTKKSIFTKTLLKWLPASEQGVYEKRLTNVMKSLKVQNYNFNWDRTSCFVEFNYNDNFYRLEHSVEKAKKSGIMLDNGLDCLAELTRSLEDLCGIIDRGMNDFETWISGMKKSTSEKNTTGFQEEFEIRYKSLGRQNRPEYNTEELTEELKELKELKELIPFGTEPSLNLSKIRLANDQLGNKARL